jgi:hypothetical protein
MKATPAWRVRFSLPATSNAPHALQMFVVSETDAAAIRSAFERGGELSAAIELRRLFPGITDNAMARAQARTFAGWQPPEPAAPVARVTRLTPKRERPANTRP